MVVLVPENAGDGYYLKDEIALFIGEERQDPQKRLIPILLAPGAARPYGLHQRIPLEWFADVTPQEIADRLAEMLQITSRPPHTHPSWWTEAGLRLLRRYLGWVIAEVGRHTWVVPGSMLGEEALINEVELAWLEVDRTEPWLGNVGLEVPDAHKRFHPSWLVDRVGTGRWAVLGDPGAGKTVVLYQLARRIARRALEDIAEGRILEARVPILAPFAELHSRGFGPVQLAARRFAADTKEKREGIEKLLQQAAHHHQAFFLLDALDEVAERTDKLPEPVRLVLAEIPVGVPVIISSRRQGVRALPQSYAQAEILPLGMDLQRRILEEILPSSQNGEPPVAERASRLLELILARGDLQDLAANPLGLSVLADSAIHAEGSPDRHARAFETFLTSMLLDELSAEGQAGPIRRQVEYLCLELIRTGPGPWAKGELERAAGQAAERSGQPARHLLRMLQTRGFLVELGVRPRQWRILHRGLWEFLAARALDQLDRDSAQRVLAELEDPADGRKGRSSVEEVLAWHRLTRRNQQANLNAPAPPAEPAHPLGVLFDEVGPAVRIDPSVRKASAAASLVLGILDGGRDAAGRPAALVKLAARSGDSATAALCAAGLLLCNADAGALERLRAATGLKILGVASKPWIQIPPGRTLRGVNGARSDQGPQHEVLFTRSIRMWATPVSQALFLLVSGHNPSRHLGDLRRPVERVNRDMIERFCHRLGRRLEVEVRLPTEAEWEYACTLGRPPSEGLREPATPSDPLAGIRPVGSGSADAIGLHDMIGLVWQMCHDWFGRYPVASKGPLIDPRGPDHGTWRVLRGGSFNSDGPRLAPTYRGFWLPDGAADDVGFRVVCEDD